MIRRDSAGEIRYDTVNLTPGAADPCNSSIVEHLADFRGLSLISFSVPFSKSFLIHKHLEWVCVSFYPRLVDSKPC